MSHNHRPEEVADRRHVFGAYGRARERDPHVRCRHLQRERLGAQLALPRGLDRADRRLSLCRARRWSRGSVRRDLLPRWRDLAPRALQRSAAARLSLPLRRGWRGAVRRLTAVRHTAQSRSPLLPLMAAHGPHDGASRHGRLIRRLLDVFGGHRRPRARCTSGFGALTLFLIVHVALVIKTRLPQADAIHDPGALT